MNARISAPGAVLPFACLGLAVMAFQGIEDTGWTQPWLRGALLLCVAVASELLAADEAGRFRRGLAALAGVMAVIVGALVAAGGARSSWAEAGLIVLIVLAPWVLRRKVPELPAFVARNGAAIAGVIATVAVVSQLASFVLALRWPDVNDIGQTTIDAGRMVLEGGNPYASPIDIGQGDPAYQGYKYLPVMIATYMPLAAHWGITGLRVTNLILVAVVAALIAVLAGRGGGRLAGLLAAATFLAAPIGLDLYRHGVTDLAAVLPMLAALLLVGRWPGLAGLAAGLALSAKLFPGALVVMCCIPPRRKLAFCLGVGLGLLPSVWFLALAPDAFLRNIVLFNLVRPPDSTSFGGTLPWPGGWLVRALAVAVMLRTLVVVMRGDVDARRRCGLIVACTVMVLLAGPSMHNNYMLWWWPPFCVLFGGWMAGLIERNSAGAAAA